MNRKLLTIPLALGILTGCNTQPSVQSNIDVFEVLDEYKDEVSNLTIHKEPFTSIHYNHVFSDIRLKNIEREKQRDIEWEREQERLRIELEIQKQKELEQQRQLELERQVQAQEQAKVNTVQSSASQTTEQPTTNSNGNHIGTFNVTHYGAYCSTCGQWGGITATGHDISNTIYHNGMRIIAVDPNVIPLGSVVTLTYPNGGSINAIALDTGSDIVGNRIDLLVSSEAEAYQLGRFNMEVYR